MHLEINDTAAKPEISQEYLVQIFIAAMEDLHDRVHLQRTTRGGDMYNAVNIARILRLLVYDEPLFTTINRTFRLEIQVPQRVMPSWPGVDANQTIAAHYEPLCPAPEPGAWIADGLWYPYSMQAYLARPQPGFVMNQQTVSPGEAIRLYANALGGVHINGELKDRDAKAAMMDNFVRIGADSAIAHLLAHRIGPDVLRGLDPLYAAAKTTTVGG